MERLQGIQQRGSRARAKRAASVEQAPSAAAVQSAIHA